jgi:hypothetical protein
MKVKTKEGAYVLEPLEGVGGEVVALRMSEDVLGQTRKDSLKVGALSS